MFIVSGCTATTPEKKNNQVSEYKGFSLHYDSNIRATPRDTYYALVESTGESQWRIVKIDKKPLSRRGFNSEIIAIDLEEMRIWPAYSSKHISRAGTTFVCMKGGHMSDAHKAGSYNGCNSNLISAGWTLERVWGEKVVVEPDPEKIASVLDVTGLLREVQNCDMSRNDDDKFLSMIQVVPKVTDESGLYAGEDLINVKRYIKGKKAGCPVKESVKYAVSISEKPGIPYEISIVPRKYTKLDFDSKGLELSPQVTIHRKLFKIFDISESLDGDELAIFVHRLNAAGGRPYVSFDIENKTDRYLTIRSISVHLKNEVYTQGFGGNQMVIPPLSKATKTLRLPYKAERDIQVRLSRSEAKRNDLSIGFSALYDDVGGQKTFFRQKKVKYAKILNL
ncbi:MAG: hypothetical protein AB2598_19410 [Candidatus Thiodiazotropha sp.]